MSTYYVPADMAQGFRNTEEDIRHLPEYRNETFAELIIAREKLSHIGCRFAANGYREADGIVLKLAGITFRMLLEAS